MAENIFPNLENEKLVSAMAALKENETPETQNAFLSAAAGAKYFTPVEVMDSEGKLIEGSGKLEVPQGAKFNFKLIKNQKGEAFFPIFTDIAEFQKWNKEAQIRTIVVTFPQMAQLVSKKNDEVKGFVINPLNENLIFPKELLDSILEHARKKVAEAVKSEQGQEAPQNVTTYLGKPTNIPDAVINSLKKSLAKHSEVKLAYFLMMKQMEHEHYLFVLDIDADSDKKKKIADSFCNAAKLFLTRFPILVAEFNSPLGEKAPEVDEPFYTKE